MENRLLTLETFVTSNIEFIKSELEEYQKLFKDAKNSTEKRIFSDMIIGRNGELKMAEKLVDRIKTQ